MKIELNEILIKDLINGYEDKSDDGVIGYGGKLDIRPPYQGEFVYKDKQRDAVIDSIKKGFPLNSIYWVKNKNKYEVLDGQQIIISICQYVNNEFSFKNQLFSGLTNDLREQFLNYKLMVYICEGDDSEKLEWFRIINIAGEKLTEQELRNAIYTGEWLMDAKKHFSKNNCPAYNLGKDYLNGKTIRQEYLETALKWINEKEVIEKYMGEHQQDKDANELWQYFQDVINWVKKLFPKYRNEMKGLEWGFFYNSYKNTSYNSNDLEQKIEKLMQDDEVENKKGIYEYLLGGNSTFLNLRTFSDNQKRKYFEKNKIINKFGKDVCICPKCKKEIEISECEADHITAWSKGGKTTDDNLQLLCKKCNAEKSNK
jgi:hypothetical protein